MSELSLPTEPARVSLAAENAMALLQQQIREPETQAVLIEHEPQGWRLELAAAVENNEFQIPRTELVGKNIDDIGRWLNRNLPRQGVTTETRDALLSDLLSLLALQQLLTGYETFLFRILTEPPCRRCGFHFDTHAPGLPDWGLLHVYNGEGTHWIDASEVRSIQAFYDWLHRRDRVVRQWSTAQAECESQLRALDKRPAFFTEHARIKQMPAGATILFRLLDISLHWSEHAPELAWFHCSPMHGATRLLVNINAARPRRR